MNLNQLAVKISEIEGKKVSVNIGQIKEIINCFGQVLCKLDENEINKLLGKIYMAGMGRVMGKKAKKKRKANGK